MIRSFLLLLCLTFMPAAAGSQAQAAARHADTDDPWLDSLAALVDLIPDEFPEFVISPPLVATPIPQDGPLTPASLDTLRAGEPLFRDDFTENDGRWSPDPASLDACFYLDGAYVLSPLLSMGATSINHVEGTDFLYEVDAAYVGGAGYGFAVGIVFRYQIGEEWDNYYRFEVQPNGLVTLIKRVSGETEVLLEPTESPTWVPDDEFAVRLGVLTDGPRLTLLLDGAVLQTVEDTSLDQGVFGLYVRSPQRCFGANCVNPSPVAIAFDNLAVWPIAASEPAPLLTPAPTIVPTAAPAPTPEATPTLPTPDSLPIDWQPLLEEFDITHLRVEEILEADMAVSAAFVLFEFEAVRDVGQVGYTAAYINVQGKVISASSVEFRPDLRLPSTLYDSLGGWKAGMKGTARFQLPGDMSKVTKIRLVRDR